MVRLCNDFPSRCGNFFFEIVSPPLHVAPLAILLRRKSGILQVARSFYWIEIFTSLSFHNSVDCPHELQLQQYLTGWAVTTCPDGDPTSKCNRVSRTTLSRRCISLVLYAYAFIVRYSLITLTLANWLSKARCLVSIFIMKHEIEV